MSNKNAPSPTETAVFEVLIRGSLDQVWHEITKRDSPQQCMFNMVLHADRLEVGGQIRMRTQNEKYTGVVGEILEFDPPHRYAHTFRFTQFDDAPCTVTYELTQEGDQVRFRLTCSDMPASTKSTKQMQQGGTMIVNTLKAVVETGRPTFGTRMLFVLFKLMEPFTPKSTRSEHWPFNKKG